MRNRRKRAQREEVRKILAEMRLELAARRLVQDQQEKTRILHLNDILTQARTAAQS